MIRALLALGLVVCLSAQGHAQRIFLQPAAYAAIARVESDLGGGAKACGSCILVDDMHAVTAAHCVSGSTIDVITGGKRYTANVIAMHLRNDWALIRFFAPLPGVRGVTIRPEPLHIGERVYGYGFGTSAGRFGAVPGTYQGDHITGTLVEQGDSGGPILDWQGRLVGVVMGYVVDTNDWHGKECASQSFRDFVQLRKYESIGVEMVD